MKKLLAMLLVSSLLLCACSDQESPLPSIPDSQRLPAPESSTPEEILHRSALSWAQSADVTTLDPHNGVAPDWQVTCNVFDTLATVDENGSSGPGLALRWSTSDAVTWLFNLRRGVSFHDGSPLTAEDVVFSLERAASSPAASYLKEVKAQSDYIVEITTTQPYAALPAALAHPSAAILSKGLVEDNPTYFAHPVGTGPYRFEERIVGESIRLSANPSYYGGAPATQTLFMRVIPDPALRLEALERGEVDIAYDIALSDVEKVRADTTLKLMSAPSMTTWCLVFNTGKTPFDDSRVRQAISRAIDRDAILQSARHGTGEPASSIVPPGAFGFVESTAYPHDTNRAYELLAEAGYPFGFQCTLWVNENPEREAICEMIKAQLLQVGIEVTVRVADYSSFLYRTGAGEHDIAFLGITASYADADGYYAQLQAGKEDNRAFYSNDAADTLIETARGTAETAKRLECYQELASHIAEEVPCSPLFHGVVLVGTAADLEGFISDTYGYHRLYTAYRPI